MGRIISNYMITIIIFFIKENETYTHFTSHCEAFHLLRTREGMTFSKD